MQELKSIIIVIMILTRYALGDLKQIRHELLLGYLQPPRRPPIISYPILGGNK